MNGFNLSRFSRVLLLMVSALALGACNFLPSETATKGAAAASGDLSDGEILQVVQNLNNGENRQAELASERSRNSDVREVAEQILQDHRSANDEIEQLTRAGIALEKSPLSRGLKRQADGIYENLSDKSGSDFDCTYLEKQIEQHELALETVRNDLQPDAENRRVRELLSTVEPALERHLRAARDAKSGITQCSS